MAQPPHDLPVRPRQAADLPALLRAMWAVHERDAYPSVWPADPLAFLAPPLTLGAWVALWQGEPAGQVVLRALTPGTVPGWAQATGLPPQEVAVVSRLFVAPAARGHGLAGHLFQAAWAEARALGKRAILDVHQKNRAAIRLYERAGWQRVATVDADWLDPGGSVPRVQVYVSPLSPLSAPT